MFYFLSSAFKRIKMTFFSLIKNGLAWIYFIFLLKILTTYVIDFVDIFINFEINFSRERHIYWNYHLQINERPCKKFWRYK